MKHLHTGTRVGKHTGTRANFYMYNALVDGWLFGAFADFFFSLTLHKSCLFNIVVVVRATLFFFVVYIHFFSSRIRDIEKVFKKPVFCILLLLLTALFNNNMYMLWRSISANGLDCLHLENIIFRKRFLMT